MNLRGLSHAELMALLDIEGIPWEQCGQTIRVLDVDRLESIVGAMRSTRRTEIVDVDEPVRRPVRPQRVERDAADALDNQSMAERMRAESGRLADEVRKQWKRTD